MPLGLGMWTAMFSGSNSELRLFLDQEGVAANFSWANNANELCLHYQESMCWTLFLLPKWADFSLCFFSMHWCLTKCIGSHSSCIDERIFLLNIPVFSSSRSGEVPACLAGQWEPQHWWQGGESQPWDAVPASPKIVWLKPVLRHIKKGAKDLSWSEYERSLGTHHRAYWFWAW